MPRRTKDTGPADLVWKLLVQAARPEQGLLQVSQPNPPTARSPRVASKGVLISMTKQPWHLKGRFFYLSFQTCEFVGVFVCGGCVQWETEREREAETERKGLKSIWSPSQVPLCFAVV